MTRRSWQAGRPYVLAVLLVGAALVPRRRRAGWFVVGLSGAVAAFFRDPDRPLPTDPGVVYAAADGVVTGVDARVPEPWLPGGEGTRVRTFLSLHNVHVNRSPVRGRVARVESREGGFAPALFARAEENRRRRLALDGPAGPLVVVQVAGLLARRISGWVGEGDRVAAGERIGMIHFGSRTDVLLPPGRADILVRAGDRVRAGVTPLARYSSQTGA
ncbi:MAG: phosphatidylserine decarboxylase [Actinomycetota bacterium]|nr:phosphatidylserine decarboxylase [Actinomycetota bacterium]